MSDARTIIKAAMEQYAVAVARAHVARCVRNGEDETVVFSDYDSEQNARVSHLLAAYDTLTRERDEARTVCDETINLLHDADREADTLRTQLAAARELMEEAAQDIEYMVNAEYHGPNDVHPAMRAKYARDIDIVTRLTAALTQEDA